jgi:hypothetical protein
LIDAKFDALHHVYIQRAFVYEHINDFPKAEADLLAAKQLVLLLEPTERAKELSRVLLSQARMLCKSKELAKGMGMASATLWWSLRASDPLLCS